MIRHLDIFIHFPKYMYRTNTVVLTVAAQTFMNHRHTPTETDTLQIMIQQFRIIRIKV
jgi:hypothetical protein